MDSSFPSVFPLMVSNGPGGVERLIFICTDLKMVFVSNGPGGVERGRQR